MIKKRKKPTKKQEGKELPEAPAVEDQEPTQDNPIIETSTDKPKAADAVGDLDIKYYEENYSTINFNAAGTDKVMCGLLFGILTEVKKLREVVEGKK